MYRVPDRRHAEFQVRIVGEYWLPTGRVLARNRPGVRTGLVFGSYARWKEEVDLRGIAALQHGLLLDFVAPGERKGPKHLQAGEDGIHRAPGPRLVMVEREL